METGEIQHGGDRVGNCGEYVFCHWKWNEGGSGLPVHVRHGEVGGVGFARKCSVELGDPF